MPIANGSNTISKIMLGGSEIQKAYLGSNLIYDQSVFVAEAVDFDGTNDYLQNSQPSYSTKQFIMSFWFNNDNTNIGIPYISAISDGVPSSGSLYVQVNSSNKLIQVIGKDSAGIINFSATSNEGIGSIGSWRHCVVSVDLAVAGSTKLYVDGIDDTSTVTFVDSFIETQVTGQISNWNSSQRYAGGIAELYIAPTQYLDLSVLSNLEKFIKNGTPVNLGADGSLPTGTAPLVYMSGDAAAWNGGTNKGTGGNFTMNGSVTDSANEPVQLP